MSLREALEFLRSAMHFVAISGTEPDIENTPNGLRIEIPRAMFYEDASGDIFFAPMPPISPQIQSIATSAPGLQTTAI